MCADSSDSLGNSSSSQNSPRLPHFETLSKLDIDNYKSGSRSSFSDSEESYSDRYNRDRIQKLKQMNKSDLKEYRKFENAQTVIFEVFQWA